MPFIVCLVTPLENILYLANTTFISKVSHSSHALRIDNIRGSINGSDIIKEFEGVKNEPENFEDLFNIHSGLEFNDNLPRLVEATNNISPTGSKFTIVNEKRLNILNAPVRAAQFIVSDDYQTLKAELDRNVDTYKNEIIIASFIENVNIRGRVIEYLIAGEDESLRRSLVESLREADTTIPKFKTKNSLGDYTKIFADYNTATDVKTKILILNSNPKAYNIDKLLEFLSLDKTVFMFYFVGIEPNSIKNTILISVFQDELLDSTILLRHWAGRNSRGVTQFQGKALNKLFQNPDNTITLDKSVNFLEKLMKL